MFSSDWEVDIDVSSPSDYDFTLIRMVSLFNVFKYFLLLQALYYCKPRVRESGGHQKSSPTLNSFTRPSFTMPANPSVCPSNPDLIAFVSQR